MRSIETTLYAGIDYKFRPGSYWTASANPLEAMLRNMKGQRRRETVRGLYAAGKLEGPFDILLSDSLDNEARNRLGQIRPTFMGREYLPDYRRHETEIARIELESTTSDAISLRARPVGSRIEYSLVDEYAFEFTLPQRTSRRPFSLRQLIRFLESIPRRFHHVIPDRRSRFFPTAQKELERVSVALRAAYAQPPRQRIRIWERNFPWELVYVLFAVIPICALFILPHNPADPLADARVDNAPQVASTPVPPPKPKEIHFGDHFNVTMPDGRLISGTYVGQANQWQDLPWTGNKIGDPRYLWEYKHWFIWLAPVGANLNRPTWIDP